MAVQRFKVAINNAIFPLVSTKAQRAVIAPGGDSAPRTPRQFFGADASADYNTAQVIYAENVIPVAEGLKSVGYVELIPPESTGVSDFDTVFPLRDEDENTVLFSPAGGKNYIHDISTNSWSASPTIEAIWAKTLASGLDPADCNVTYAYVDGKTFVCYSRLKSNDTPTATDMSIMFWDSTTQSLTPSTSLITNLPFGPGEIDGVSSSSGYLLVWSGLTIAWAPFSGAAFDFTIYSNGAFTGSGFQIPEDIQGPVTSIIGMAGGFVAFTLRNAIAASYHAQSIASPWVFREVPDAGGLDSYEQATVEGSLSRLVAYTSAGMQTISLNSAEIVHPQVADFITGRQIERYDFSAHRLIRGVATVDLYTKVTAIGNRFIVVSYGFFPGTYSYALVYDLALERWGKLRIVHRDCFNYTYPAPAAPITYAMALDVTYADVGSVAYEDLIESGEGITPAQNSMAFVAANGSVRVATWADRTNGEDAAVVILGRVQLTRARNIQLNRVEVEGMTAGGVYVQASSNGRNIDRVDSTYTVEQTSNYLAAGCMIDCKNFNLILEGSFNLSTVVCEAVPTGQI
jgi:hypothetical protein